VIVALHVGYFVDECFGRYHKYVPLPKKRSLQYYPLITIIPLYIGATQYQIPADSSFNTQQEFIDLLSSAFDEIISLTKPNVHCHGRNPEVPYNTLTSARSRNIIEIDDAPSRSSISTTNLIAPRFGSYNRHGAETLRQSQPLRHNSIRRGNRGGPAADRPQTAYPAVVSFYVALSALRGRR
jgi:hypothetical protein